MSTPTSNASNDPRPSDERNGCFLDKMWCCKVCDGEIPDGHTDNCDIWKLEKKHRDFLANEYNAVLVERDQLKAELAERGSHETGDVLETVRNTIRCRDAYVSDNVVLINIAEALGVTLPARSFEQLAKLVREAPRSIGSD